MDIYAADDYIEQNVIDIEDWQEADEEKKQRILNTAIKTLERKFASYTVPSSAVYYFCAVLAVVFSDTNRLQQHGVAGFSITGVSSFTFKENNVRTPGGQSMSSFIPDEVYALVGEANGVTLSKRRVGRSVR